MHLQNQDRGPNFGTWIYQRPVTYPNKDQDVKPQSGTSCVLQSPKSGIKGHRCSFHLQIKIEIQNSDYGYINDQWPYTNQDQDAKTQSGTSSILQAPSQDLEDMDVLYTFQIKIESQN